MTVASHLRDSRIAKIDSLPPFVLDLEASSIEYVGNNSPDLADAAELKSVIGNVLNARTEKGSGQPEPARFRARYNVARHVWPISWTIICIDLQLLGCPTGGANVTAEIDLQIGNQFFHGSGNGSALGGLYYNGVTGTPAALAEATEQAMSSLMNANAPAPSAPMTERL